MSGFGQQDFSANASKADYSTHGGPPAYHPTGGDDHIANKEWLPETAKNQVASGDNVSEFVARVLAWKMSRGCGAPNLSHV